MALRTLTAVIHKEDDLYVAQCPEVGTVSQGYTIEEAIANLREATELSLEEFSRLNIKLSTESFKTMLASEQVVGRDWQRPEEDEAWDRL